MANQTFYEKYESLAQRIGVDVLISIIPRELFGDISKYNDAVSIPLAKWETLANSIAMETLLEIRKLRYTVQTYERICLLKHVAFQHLKPTLL